MHTLELAGLHNLHVMPASKHISYVIHWVRNNADFCSRYPKIFPWWYFFTFHVYIFVILDSWLHLGNLTLKKISNFIITVFWSQNKWKVSANVSNKYLNKGMQEFQVHVALNVINYLYFLTTTCLFNFSSSLHMFQFPSIHENMYKKPQPGSDKNWYKGSILSIWNQQTSHFHCPAHDFPYIWCNNCSVVTWQLLSWWSYKMSFNDAVSHFHW